METLSPITPRPSCTECQRRKQKMCYAAQCNREWPRNFCQKRRVADKCRFSSAAGAIKEKPAPPAGQKRSRPFDDDGDVTGTHLDCESNWPGLETVGYVAGPLVLSLGVVVNSSNKAVQKMDWVAPEESFPMRQALAVLPTRPKMDALVQYFFDNVNYHYYILYPTTFLKEYQEWWDRRYQNKSVSIQWTSLLLTVCSSTIQHLDVDEKLQLETDFGESADILTERYLNTSRELANSAPNGHYHLLNVQRMLHTIYWYKVEARFIEAWHLMVTAVREAQELGLPNESASKGLSGLDREMRQRVWCILITWDWQFASVLGRPVIIDQHDIGVLQPTPDLEGRDPSPLQHIKLQAEAVARLVTQFGAPRNIESPEQIQEYLQILESWVRGFPVVYSTEKPDHSQDASYPWVISHRFHIHTMAYLTILNPLRAYLARTYSGSSNKEALPIREIGVHYALKVVETAVAWAEDDHHTGGAFYYMVFSLFDTVAVLSAAIIKDKDLSMPQRDDVLQGIHKAVKLLRRLSDSTKTAAVSFRLLYRLVEQVPQLTCDIRREQVERSTPSSADRDPMPTLIQGTQAQQTLQQRIRHTEGDGTPQTNQSRAASASSYQTCDSATVGSAPQSQNVPKPDEPDREVAVLGQSPYASSVDQHLTYGGDDFFDLNRPLAYSFVSLEEISPRSDGLASVSLGIEAQFMAPVAMENFVVEPITDPELGEFYHLWDWEEP